MRLMSFQLTTDQIRNRTKTVTRRLGWANLRRGTLLCGVVKSQGIPKGETVERLAYLVVVRATREPLNLMSLAEQYGDREAIAEGFPELRGYEFVRMFRENMKCDDATEVTRIEFRYIPGGTFKAN